MNPFNLLLLLLGFRKKDGEAAPADGLAPSPGEPAWVVSVKWGIRLATLIGVIVLCFLKWHKTGELPDTVPVILNPAPGDGNAPPEVVKAFGWQDDASARAEAFAARPPLIFAETPAGKVIRGDAENVYLWRFVRKASGKKDTEDWYPNINQQDVGCCVGCAYKHAADVCQAEQVVTEGGEFRPLSAEVIYGISRVDVGGGRLRGDGSLGTWAKQGIEDFGVVAMAKYAGDDLSIFSPSRARHYGAQGVPGDIKEEAKRHPVRATALVQSWEDVQKAVSQGYPVAVCSTIGFEDRNGAPGTRDKDGFCAPRGTWPHAMCFIGVRGGPRPGAFCLNSWGNDAHRGPRFPADAPSAGFWVDKSVVAAMVSQGDSYSLSDLKGFEARNLDWLASTRPLAAPHPARGNPFRVADLLFLAP